jgi:hypothetical protein
MATATKQKWGDRAWEAIDWLGRVLHGVAVDVESTGLFYPYSHKAHVAMVEELKKPKPDHRIVKRGKMQSRSKPAGDVVVWIGAVDMKTGEVLLDTPVKPLAKWHKEALALAKRARLDFSALDDAPDFLTALYELALVVGDRPMISWGSFDNRALRQTALAAGFTLDTPAEHGWVRKTRDRVNIELVGDRRLPGLGQWIDGMTLYGMLRGTGWYTKQEKAARREDVEYLWLPDDDTLFSSLEEAMFEELLASGERSAHTAVADAQVMRSILLKVWREWEPIGTGLPLAGPPSHQRHWARWLAAMYLYTVRFRRPVPQVTGEWEELWQQQGTVRLGPRRISP